MRWILFPFAVLWWILLLLPSMIVNVASTLGAPLWARFADDAGAYPWWLRWAATWDFGADGDPPFISQHAPFPGVRTGAEQLANRIAWMRRNPAYGWDKWIGATVTDIALYGSRPLSGDLKSSGWFFAIAADGTWQLYITHHWTDKHCTKINLGWKLWLAPDRCTFVCSPTGWWKLIT
ncbi:MAG: hypothetical protein WC100_00955 [Sterolibacterium sp.]